MIRAIAAIDDKRGLATDAGIPWDIPADVAHERQLTKGGNMLMGLATYKEFDTAPSDRQWYVLTDVDEPLKPGFHAVTDLAAFMVQPPKDLWLFGGAGVFAQTISAADELCLTRIQGDFHCTKFFPEFEADFELTTQEPWQTQNNQTFRFETWTRKKS